MGRLKETAKRLLNLGSSSTGSKVVPTPGGGERRKSGDKVETHSKNTTDGNAHTLVLVSSSRLSREYAHACLNMPIKIVDASSVREVRTKLPLLPGNCCLLFELDDLTNVSQMIKMVKDKAPRSLKWIVSSSSQAVDMNFEEQVLFRRSKSDIDNIILYCLQQMNSICNRDNGGTKSLSQQGWVSPEAALQPPFETGEVDETSQSGNGKLPRPSRTTSISQSSHNYEASRNLSHDIEDPMNTPISDLSPGYLLEIPEDVAVFFGEDGNDTLHLDDNRFRRLVKHVCKFPAYFDTVVYDRIRQYRELAQQLVENGSLAPESLNSVPGFPDTRNNNAESGAAGIKLRDFLRFWTPAVRYSGQTTRFLAVVVPPDYEKVLNLETDDLSSPRTTGTSVAFRRNRVHMEDIRPLIESLIDRHPDLRQIRDNVTKRERYAICVLTSLFSSVNGLCKRSITIRQLKNSGVANLFYKCATRNLGSVLPFSLRYFEEAHEVFEEAAASGQSFNSGKKQRGNRATIDVKGILSAMSLPIIRTVLERIFYSNVKELSSGIKGQLDFQDFMWFLLAKEDQMRELSVDFWCRALDLDDDGYVSRQDLEEICRDKLTAADLSAEEVSKLQYNMMSQFLDVVAPGLQNRSDTFPISPLDIKKSGAGYIVFDLFISSSLQPLRNQPKNATQPPSKYVIPATTDAT